MQPYRLLKKIVILLVGVPLFGLGIILIPLPGPGILVCFLALFILSLEFEWPRPYLQKARLEIEKIIRASKARQAKIERKLPNDDTDARK